MVIKTYIEKCNTIIENSSINTGLNPISELIYGGINTRMLIYFDMSNLKKILTKNGVTDFSTIKHILHMTNCGFVNMQQIYQTEDSVWDNKIKIRASSFDLIFFLIPQHWDGGKGYDYSLSFFNQGYHGRDCENICVNTNKLVVTDGCNWYQAKNGYEWKENGIYDNLTLSKEYDKFSFNDTNSIIIGRQHFDKGYENINVDISETVNKFLNGDIENYGIGIAYTPMLELEDSEIENYVGFFTCNTNTFFAPYLETIYDDTINDDRNNFILDKKNKLYLYCNIGGELTNLDELPICTINSSQIDVKQASEGVYYVELLFSSQDHQPNTMYYDIWSNLKYNGISLTDIEMDFVTKSPSQYFHIGNNIMSSDSYIPILSGIKYDEKIGQGEKRKIIVTSKTEYSRHKAAILTNLEYKLYVKDGEREIIVIDYQKINQTYNENYFIIDTSMLLPQRYYIDIRYNLNLEIKQHTNVLTFDIVNNVTEKFLK